MANNKGVFQNILQLLLLCMAIELIVQLHVSARLLTSNPDDDLIYNSVPFAKSNSKIFEPLPMKLSNTVRTGAKADQYKKDLLEGLHGSARKEDRNLKMTGESCARGLGSLYKVITNDSKLLYELCYDDQRSSAVYTTHIVDLANKALERSSHLSFKAPYTLYGNKINDKYNAVKQTERFTEVFGKGITSAELKEMNYFSRNHLTPHADFPLASEQELTYYYQNCVPGKQSMNQGNWSTMEALIRTISIQMDKVLRVFTGVYGILAKKDKKGQMTDLYLDYADNKNAIEVPLIIWKLVIDTKTNDSVAFFTSNDTDMDDDQVAHFSTLCNSVCDELGYNLKSGPKSGITLCCQFDEFIKHVRYLPIKLKKSKLLKNSVRLGKLAGKGPKGRKNSKNSDDEAAIAA